MPVSRQIRKNMERSSWIRRMFEEGVKLKAEFGADKVFDFSLGNPDLEPPEAFRAVMRRLVEDTSAGTHGYMPNAGYPAVREAVARKASAQQGLDMGASSIVMTVGAAGGLNTVLKALLDPGDEVVLVKPYFAEYYFFVQNQQGAVVEVDSGPGFSLDAEKLRSSLSPRTAAVIVNSPNNPTGVIYTRAQLDALAAVLSEHGARTGRMPYLIADEPYREIVYGGAQVPSAMLAYPETIVVTSWSKTLSLPGERIGYIAVSPRCADAKELFEGMAMCTRTLGYVNAPALMQRAVAELLDEKCDVASYARRGAELARGLRAAGYEFPDPEGAFYIFAKAPEPAPSRRADAEALGLDVAFVMHLKKYNILGVPGQGFGTPGWFRLSYCVSEATIRGAIPLFARAMEDWKAGS
ncbi:MAG TPA: pyridoxal phosphate-dependent aminotransferase [Rectinemataceae bacterium]|nr:pyridoxal phosphate-dependent aminotransferase [Rectinemataceae bacterium]